ncbi:ArsC/Spx/MgsR family protein [Lactococcus garvieae]|uniref:ArsC/Spx/MgsR family protein n=1 Tax=Lactococcus garvieae TaxID=1363 RepID=UPI00254D5597|nr:ArsC/Spx/MgsR family protein [Lactococcus garvieae]
MYWRKNCASSKQALLWFETHRIAIEYIELKKITHKELIDLLLLTDNGFDDILKNRRTMKGRTKATIKTLDSMSFEEAIDYLVEHVEILQTPIIVDKNQLFVGFNTNEIRQFIPSINRKLDMRRNNG